MIENNKDVILHTVPWQLLSCHYKIMKSFPCLTWRHIIMIKNNNEMSINAMPLLPHILSLEIPTCSSLIFLSIFYNDAITIIVGGMLKQSQKSVLLNLYFVDVRCKRSQIATLKQKKYHNYSKIRLKNKQTNKTLCSVSIVHFNRRQIKWSTTVMDIKRNHW